MVKLFQQMFRFIFPYLLQGVLSIFLAIPIVRAAPTNDLRLITFQQFIQHRPTYIQAIMYDITLATNVSYIKWQPNACFLGTIWNHVPPWEKAKVWPSKLTDFEAVDARWENIYWQYANTLFYTWTNHGDSTEQWDHKILRKAKVIRLDFWQLLNLGQIIAPPENLVWEKGILVATNQESKFVAKGVPQWDANGRVTTVQWTVKPFGWFHKKESQFTVRLFYEDPNFPNLPTRAISDAIPGLTKYINIRWIELSSRPHSIDEFRLRVEDFVPQVQQITTIKGDHYVSIRLKDRHVIAWREKPKVPERPRFKVLSVLVIGLLFVASLALVLWGWWKKRKPQ